MKPKDDYYRDKAKDSKEQAVLLIWLVIIIVALGTWYCTYKWLTHKCPEQTQIERNPQWQQKKSH